MNVQPDLMPHVDPWWLGYTDGAVGLGMAVLTATNIALWGLTAWLFKKGYRLKT